MSFLEYLHAEPRRVIVFDGAMGTNLQAQNLTAEDFGGKAYEGCNEYLVISKPEAVAKVHRDFLAAGADVIETNTFGASSVVLSEYNLGDRAYEISKKAAELAKSVAAEFSTPEKPRFVAGSMGLVPNSPPLATSTTTPSTQLFANKRRVSLMAGLTYLLLKPAKTCCKSRRHSMG